LAIKLTAVMYCIPLGLIVVATGNFRGVIAFGLAAATVFLALWGPHGWKLWMEFGNPLFPLYNDIFKSPDWAPERLDLYQRYLPRSVLEYLSYPFTWARPQSRVVELSTQDLRLSLLLVGLLISLAVYLTRSILRRYETRVRQTIINNRVSVAFLAFLVLSYFIWLNIFGAYRFLIVVESLSGAGLMLAAAGIFQRHRAAVPAVLVGSFALCNLVVKRPDWGHVPYGAHVISVEPLQVPPEGLVIIADNTPQGYLVAFVPRTARVVGINSNFIRPGQPIGLNKRLAEIVRSHSGPIVVISGVTTEQTALDQTLSNYGLRASDCRIVRSNIEPSGHRVCAGARKNG
jgi:hypothetical protein